MNILISNDDGINAEGIKILAEEISKIANTYVVAPDSPRSASGHAITLHKPILINDEFIAENVEAYSTSGTPAAAIEGLIEGKPSIALSCDSSKVSSGEYREAAKYTAKLIQKLEGNLDKLNGNILNVNFPTGEKKGVRITKLGRRVYNNVMDDRQSIRGQRYVWMGGDLEDIKQDKDSDIFAVENGYISITPVHINMTETNRIEELKELGLEE